MASWAFAKSPWILHFNTGSCNGCDIEIFASLTPKYDLERIGALLKGSPRHADVLVVSGPVTRQACERILRIYKQMPEPKSVVAVGTCCISGGVFTNCGKGPCYNVYPGLDSVLPVDVYVPGCPPRPEAIMDGIAKAVGKMRGRNR